MVILEDGLWCDNLGDRHIGGRFFRTDCKRVQGNIPLVQGFTHLPHGNPRVIPPVPHQDDPGYRLLFVAVHDPVDDRTKARSGQVAFQGGIGLRFQGLRELLEAEDGHVPLAA